MADSAKNEFIYRNRSVPKEYWTMTQEQKREWAKSLLESFSPNPEVRERAQKKNDK